jgi:hypothetical protein
VLRAISADIVHAADPRHLVRRPPAADLRSDLPAPSMTFRMKSY